MAFYFMFYTQPFAPNKSIFIQSNFCMKSIYCNLVLVIMAFSFFQCQKDLSYSGEPDPIPNVPVINIVNPEPITANLQGNVVDENNQPAAGVNIRVGNKAAITDVNGYFRILNAPLDKKSALVVAERSGYFKGYRLFAATSGTNNVAIKLVKKNLAGTVSGATGGNASLSNRSKIVLPVNGVVIASSGAVYTGNVKVYASYIDPTANDISTTIPGSFAATDKNNSRVTLSSYGMLAVELESDAGEKLQIKSGLKATLTTAIPASVLSSAPATIALWSIDEQTGLWKEEGTATKQGNTYVGEVSHFSFWNCDVPMNAVYVSMKLQTIDSLPIVYGVVKITVLDSTNRYAFGWTDSLGQVSGAVPSNVALKIEVLDPCFNAVFTQNVLPLSQNTDLGTITVTSTTSINTIKGILLNCSGLPVTNGYAIITVNNIARYAATDTNGEFSINFIACSATVSTGQIIGVDINAQQQSSVSNININSPSTNLGNITACGISTVEYINYVYDGITYNISNINSSDSLYGFTNDTVLGPTLTTLISGYGTNKSLYFEVSFCLSPGTYDINTLQCQNFSNNNITILYSKVTFTKFPLVIGDFYEGTTTSEFKDSVQTTHNITSTFRVKRSM